MNLETIQDTMWAIHPAKLEEIDAVVRKLLAGEKIDFEAAASGTGGGDARYEVTSDGIAVIEITGTLMKRANLISRWSGGASTQLLKADIAKALEDPKVRGILLWIDSPGGVVHGTKDLVDFILAGRSVKPIVAFTDGLMCSAAYWIASATGEIVASQTSESGSIGTALTHYDTSKADESAGLKRTEVYAGKYKRIVSSGPLSKEGKEYLQDQVDTYYSIFVESVAANRGVGVEKALSMADGRTFIGVQALEIGLVDRIGNMDTALNSLRKGIEAMTEEQIKKLQLELEETRKQLAEAQTGNGNLKALEERLADALKAQENMSFQLRRKEIEAAVSKLVSEGKLTPANVDAGVVAFLMAVDGTSHEAGGKTVKASEYLLALLDERPPVLEFAPVATRERAAEAKAQADQEVETGLAIAKAIGGSAE